MTDKNTRTINLRPNFYGLLKFHAQRHENPESLIETFAPACQIYDAIMAEYDAGSKEVSIRFSPDGNTIQIEGL